MEQGADLKGPSGLRRPTPRALRFMAATLVAIALSLLILSSRGAIAAELRVHVPAFVPGDPELPVRAYVYEGLSAIEGPRLGGHGVYAELRDGERVVHRVALHAGLGPSHEGVVPLPPRVPEGARLHVEAIIEGEDTVAVAVPLRQAPRARVEPTPRALRALQQLSFGPVRPQGAAVDGPSLVVGGGVCLPELPCELWAFASGPFRHVAVRGRGSAEVVSQQALDGEAPVARVIVVVHGPEGSVDMEATDGAGQGVRQRAVRLPVGLGAVALSPAPRLPDAALQLAGEQPGACIVDAYVAGRLRATKTTADCLQPFTPPTAGADPVRLQVRRDPFESQSVAVRVLPSPAQPLQEIARAVLSRGTEDATLRRLAEGIVDSPPVGAGSARDLALRGLLLSALEQGLYSLPPGSSSQPAAEAAARQRGRMLQAVALALILLAGTLILGYVGLTGYQASARADALMAEAGQDRVSLAHARRVRRGGVGLALVALSVCFLAVAAYVLVRFGG